MPSERETAFPQLTDAEIDLLRPGGRVRDVKAGDVLFAEGDRGFSFYVVLAGAVEIIEHSRGVAHTVTVHEARAFTGDVDMLTGRVALVTGLVARDGQVLELSAAALRQAVDENPELGDIILKAFLTRRTLLLGEGFEGVKIIGSRFSPDTPPLCAFARRNSIPVQFLRLEAH